MEIRHSDLVVTSSTNRVSTARALRNGFVQIGHCTHLSQRKLHASEKPWVTRQRVAEARILTVQHLISTRARNAAEDGDFLFSGESALVILGLQPWWNNPDVVVRRVRRSGHKCVLPAVPVHSAKVPEVRLVQIRHKTKQLRGSGETSFGHRLAAQGVEVDPYETGVHSGIRIAPAHLIVYDLCRLLHPLQAFHNVSLLLRHLARWDSRDLAGSRQRVQIVRQALRQDLDTLGAVPRIRRTRALLASADGGLESPAESIVLWSLRSIVRKPSSVLTQVPVTAGKQNFRIDIGVPAAKLAIEVTGRGKFGESSTSAYEVADRFVARQQMLEAADWRVINITYDQAKKLTPLMDWLRKLLSQHGIVTGVPDPLVWAEASPLLLAKSRRY